MRRARGGRAGPAGASFTRCSPGPVGRLRHPEPDGGEQPEPRPHRQDGGAGAGRHGHAEEDGLRGGEARRQADPEAHGALCSRVRAGGDPHGALRARARRFLHRQPASAPRHLGAGGTIFLTDALSPFRASTQLIRFLSLLFCLFGGDPWQCPCLLLALCSRITGGLGGCVVLAVCWLQPRLPSCLGVPFCLFLYFG